MKAGGRVSLSDMRPPLLGFDQHVAGLTVLTNHVIALRMERPGGNSRLKTIQGPVYPLEIVEQRLADYRKSKRDGGIAAAQLNWMEAYGNA